MLWLKFIHIGAVLVWVGGLLYLPAMLIAHHDVVDRQDFARIRMASRFIYMGLASPAAFLAFAAGTALLFVSDALHPWMFLKLIAVGLLVVGHLQYGRVLTHLADEEARAPTLRVRLIEGGAAVSVLAILTLVLWKPQIGTDLLPSWLTEPGLLAPPESEAPHPYPPHPPLRRS